MNSLKDMLYASAKTEGIDLLGFAGKDRFEAVDAQHNPFSIFPEGKTVIMLGKRICRGSLRGVEEGTNFGDYNLFGAKWLEDQFLSIACYDLVRVLEDEGWEAVPIFPNPSDIAPMGVPVKEGMPAPNVFPDFDYAAVACGLGEIGMSGLLLTPEFGSRQRFHMIITDAPLEASPLLDKPVCLKCGACVAACPLGAMDGKNTAEIEICGKKMTVASINYDVCRECKNGAVKNRFSATSKPDRIPALCNRTCICALEKAGTLSNRFETPFRKRDAWEIGSRIRNEADPANELLGGCFVTNKERGKQ